jgi:hypothetical protein
MVYGLIALILASVNLGWTLCHIVEGWKNDR